jgi:hypothetical protein
MEQLTCYKNEFNDNNETIKGTQALLYTYYVEHYKWHILEENPSGILIKTLDDKKILVDDYDQHSIFFSVTDEKNEVIACARLCAGNRENHLEIEKYHNARESLAFIFKKKSHLNILEMTREGISLNYIDDERPYLLLLREIFIFCLDGNYSLLATTHLDEWEKIYKSIRFPKLENKDFKYFDDEPVKANVYFCLNGQIKKIIYRIDSRLKHRETADAQL